VTALSDEREGSLGRQEPMLFITKPEGGCQGGSARLDVSEQRPMEFMEHLRRKDSAEHAQATLSGRDGQRCARRITRVHFGTKLTSGRSGALLAQLISEVPNGHKTSGLFGSAR
jgi:hypothetical protein